MCGIVGYIGQNEALPILVGGLKKLEYRGYDSSGIAVIENGSIHVVKASGKISALEDKLKKEAVTGKTGIAHTRWATHGAPTDKNAHPHLDGSGRIGISAELRAAADLDKNVVLVGNTDHFEIWDAKRWDEFCNSVDLSELFD